MDSTPKSLEVATNGYKTYLRGLTERQAFTPLNGKAAYLPEWHKNPVRLEDVPESKNVGLLLEHAGLTDLDLDSIEAQYTVPAFLDIDTLAVGRGGTIRRYLYEGAAENRTYKDLNGDVLLEVRHLGKQTMWAGSTHPDTGEAIEVMRDVRPLPMPDEEAIYKAATSALIARHLPAGGRHDLAMAYAGFLLRKGLTEDEVFEMLWTAWELNDPSADADKDLNNIIRHTAEKIAQDKPATGGNTLTQMIPGMTDKISEYWRWDQVLTHEEKEEQERQEQVKRAEESWENPKVQRIAKSYDILDTFRSELNSAGIVGVDREVQLLFMAGCSRLLDRPISIAIKGPSSAGKSHVMENALIKPLPDHAVKFFTSMSERALIYSQEDYRHTMIAIAEQSGVNSPFLDYIIRTLLSESRIEYETVEKLNGKHFPRKIIKPGPTGSVISTTQPNLHPENETRILSVWIKDTREQTAQVMRSIAREVPEKDFTAWKAYGIWLEGQDNRVWIPYAESLSRQIASLHVRQRRDFKLLLNTIKTVAFMHQQRRERDYQGRIIATLRDYEIARELLNDLLSEGIGATVSKTIRETVAAVKALTVDATPKQEHTTNKAVAAELDIDPSSASARVKNALTAGYLVDVQEPGRRGRKLTLGADLPEDVSLLPEPDDMARSYINQEIAAVCNIVGQLDADRKGTGDASWLRNLVGKIVGHGSPINVSVATLEKPYEDRKDENSADISQKTERNQHGSLTETDELHTPPNPVQLSNYVTKSPYSGADPIQDQQTSPTNDVPPKDGALWEATTSAQPHFCDTCSIDTDWIVRARWAEDYWETERECENCGYQEQEGITDEELEWLFWATNWEHAHLMEAV